MIMTSVGQWNNQIAREIYKGAGRHADSLVKLGRIAASDRSTVFAKLVAERLASANLPIPSAIAASAGVETAKVGTATVAQAVGNGAVAATKTSVLNVATGTFRTTAPVSLAIFAAEGVYTTVKYVKGDIDIAEAGRRTAESAAVNSGGLGGSMAGAAIGTAILPGIGTIIGSIIGGAGGAVAFGKIASKFTRK